MASLLLDFRRDKLRIAVERGGHESCRCLFNCVKSTEMPNTTMSTDGGGKPPAGERVNALRKPLILAPNADSVDAVLRARCLSEIAPGIVSKITAHVVNLIRWPPAKHVKKRETVGKIHPLVNQDLSAPFRVNAPSFSSGFCQPTASNAPSKSSGFGVVIQQLMKPHLCQIASVFHAFQFTANGGTVQLNRSVT